MGLPYRFFMQSFLLGFSNLDLSVDTAVYRAAFCNHHTLYMAYIIRYDFTACNISRDMGVIQLHLIGPDISDYSAAAVDRPSAKDVTIYSTPDEQFIAAFKIPKCFVALHPAEFFGFHSIIDLLFTREL